jgi:hypothetical protein
METLFTNSSHQIIQKADGTLMFDNSCCCCFCDPAPKSLTMTIGSNATIIGEGCSDWSASWVLDSAVSWAPGLGGAGCACYQLTEGLPYGCTGLFGCIFLEGTIVCVSITFTWPAGAWPATTMMLTFQSQPNNNVPPGPCCPARVPWTGTGTFYSYGIAGSPPGSTCGFFAMGAAVPGYDVITITCQS